MDNAILSGLAGLVLILACIIALRHVSRVNRTNIEGRVRVWCFFDTEKCQDGIQALRHYRYEFANTWG
jgi:hypothetical protein